MGILGRREAKRIPTSKYCTSRSRGSRGPTSKSRTYKTRDFVVVVVVVIVAHSDKETRREVETRERLRTQLAAARRGCFTRVLPFSQGHPIILQNKEQGVGSARSRRYSSTQSDHKPTTVQRRERGPREDRSRLEFDRCTLSMSTCDRWEQGEGNEKKHQEDRSFRIIA